MGGFVKTCPNEFERVSGSFGECLEKCDLFAGAASGTCLEALARGWPVAVLDARAGLDCPIPEAIDKKLWKLCGDAEKLRETVLYFKSSGKEGEKRLAEAGAEIRRDYFEKITAEAARKFLES